MIRLRFLILVVLLGTFSLNGFGQKLIGDSSEAEHKFTDWADRNAIQLKTTVPGDDFSDMVPLGDVVGEARIVELGEATHGTSEFFQMKDRMVRYLATQKGFTIFSIEANMPEAYRLNDYVLNGVGDPKALLKGMYFWTWNTQEVLDMILWMRQYNLSGKGRMEFTGFDMQTPTLSLENVRQFVAKYDAAYLPTLTTNYHEVGKIDVGEMPSPFGMATAQLPIGATAGPRVTLRGLIKTDSIQSGFAGLWLRADGPPGSPALAFNNMSEIGPHGTTPWTRYHITMNVPASARALYFGAVHSGTGDAWFDGLAVDIDGAPYKPDGNILDLRFESPLLRGFKIGGDGYIVQLDPAESFDGKQSLRIEQVAAVASAAPPVPVSADLLDQCVSVFDHMTQRRDGYIKAGASAKETDWAVQNARLVMQFAELKSGMATRDRDMAENIRWIANQNPGAKIIVWAHNGHVGYHEYSMGGYLKKYFGGQIVNFGFIFDQGSFRAFDTETHQLVNFTVGPAPSGTWESALAATRIPLFALNLRLAAFDPETVAWMNVPHRTHSLGAVYNANNASNYWYETQLQNEFDAIFFVEKTTASHGLP